MRAWLTTVVADEIVSRRNVQVTDVHRLQQYLKSSLMKDAPSIGPGRFPAAADYAARRASMRSGRLFRRSNPPAFESTLKHCYRFRKNCETRRAISRAPVEFMPQVFLIRAAN